jgi:zinc D-Ala-D-Ala dipeptidase
VNDDFSYVDEVVRGVRWDAKYATWDNFTGKPVDGYQANRIVGTDALCAALGSAQQKAESLGFGLVLWDGYRPQRAVDAFMRWAEQPDDDRIKARFHPNISRADMFAQGYVATKSGHTRGSTVDLTIYDLAGGELLPMGGDHDLMDEISHHGAAGVGDTEAKNREHLRALMESCGFTHYAYEWWHYTLKDEPYPDTYFDFPIT